MALKLVWTSLARDDLRGIVSYVARDNPSAALRVGERILSSVEPLKSMPQMGRMVPERQDVTIREIVRGNYRIIYRVREEQVFGRRRGGINVLALIGLLLLLVVRLQIRRGPPPVEINGALLVQACPER